MRIDVEGTDRTKRDTGTAAGSRRASGGSVGGALITTVAGGVNRPQPSGGGAAPWIDRSGQLRFEGRQAPLTDKQQPVVAHLIDHLGAMVPVGDLTVPYAAAGGSPAPAAMRSLMLRTAHQLAQVGLEVTFARRRAGMMVAVPAATS